MLKEGEEQLRATEFFRKNSIALHDLLNERPGFACHLFNR